MSAAIAVPPVFMNQKQTSRYLCRSEEWLRRNALRHDLYKPSGGKPRQGTPALYHRDHIDIIARHMVSPEVFTEDAALLVWRRLQANAGSRRRPGADLRHAGGRAPSRQVHGARRRQVQPV